MAVMSLFCQNFRVLKTPAVSLLGQTSSRTITFCSSFQNKGPILAANGRHCSVLKPEQPQKSLFQIGQIRLLSQQPPEQVQPQHEESFEEHEKTIYKGILATQVTMY
jgi:hypothetical protein